MSSKGATPLDTGMETPPPTVQNNCKKCGPNLPREARQGCDAPNKYR